MAYWELSDLEDRLSAEVVLQILDDDNDGVVDVTPLERLQSDADAYVEGYLRGIYDLAVLRADPPEQVKRLSLDCAAMRLARRHKEYVRHDWKQLKEDLDEELMLLRKGLVRLDVVGSPEPGANQGGSLVAPGESGGVLTTGPLLFFNGPCGMGDF